MQRLAIGLENDGQIVFDKPEFNKGGWLENYRLRLVSDDMNVETTIQNPPYGEMLPDFFAELTKNWKGWDGKKAWRAMEDEFRLEVSMTKTGHVTLKATLNLHQYQWRAIAKIMIEAGQLERIENHVREFFQFK
jgi:hypothetical protein